MAQAFQNIAPQIGINHTVNTQLLFGGNGCSFFDFDNDGWDDEDGYHLDKYSNVEDIQYELDNPNLKKVTGLKKLVGEESDDEEEEDGECNEEVGAGKIGGDKGKDDVDAMKEA